MFRHYFKTALRTMQRNKLFTGLNIFGLATGLACSILIFLWVKDELSYDKFNTHAERIFRLSARVKDVETVTVPPAFTAAMKDEIPGIKNTARLVSLARVITVGTKKFDEAHMYYADSNFLQIFDYPLLRGSRPNVLSAPNTVVLTEATAIKYFGSADQAMGKSIYIDNDIKGSTLQVTGILKNIPANSHLQFNLLLPIQNWDKQIVDPQPWRYFDSYVYFQLADEIQPTRALQQKLEQQLNTIRNNATKGTPAVPAIISVQPLADIHLYSHFRNDVDGQGNAQYVRIFTLVALFIIFIACINFMNLATALSGARAKEVGLRKTIGALRRQLIFQFIGESILLAFLSLCLALVFVRLALPFFNTLASKSISLDLLDIRLIGQVLVITLLVGLLAGSYPAFYISTFNVIRVLKGTRAPQGKTSFLRNGLVVVQFSISVALIVSTIVIYNQLHYLHNRDIGFNKENLLYIPMPEVGDLRNNADALKSALDQSPQIGNYSIVSDLPTDLNTQAPLTWRNMEKGSLVICQRLNVDESFARTFDIHMASGRFYSKEFKENDSEYVINETAARAMQMDPATAIGKMITVRGQEGVIIGVAKDFNFRPVFQPIEPLVIRHRAQGDYLVIRTAPSAMQKTLASAKACFQKVYGNNPFSYGFVDQDLDHLYSAETRMGSIFNIFSILSIAISCLGLFGLATFSTQRRAKEIGVRKVLGASETGIVLLLTKEFLQLVALSLLIAFPIAWYAMHRWLEGFVYRIDIDAWVFITAGVAALSIASLTVGYQTIRTALASPVNALKSE
ncbi:MAG TPA: ABC transporter permease [Puia sp.]|nr:ABC transporter permease [Puia sp.]